MKKAKEKPPTKKEIQKKKDEIGKIKKEEKENENENEKNPDEEKTRGRSPINRKAKETKDKDDSDEVDEESGEKIDKHERKGPGVMESLKAKISEKMCNLKETIYSKIPNRP